VFILKLKAKEYTTWFDNEKPQKQGNSKKAIWR